MLETRPFAEASRDLPNPRTLQVTLIMVTLISAVMASLGAPLIPTIARSTGVSLSAANWFLTAALLTGALATPIMGRVADGPYQRRVVVAALSIVLTGLVMAAVSDNFAVLLVGRAMQGLGVSLMPVTMTIARRYLAPDQAGRAIAALSVTAVAGTGLGFPMSGLVAQTWGFHAAFWAGAGVAALALMAAVVVLPGPAPVAAGRFDVVGAALISMALTCLIVVLSEADRWGWLSATVIGPFAFAIVLALLWARYELRTPDPLIELRQARHRMVLMADLAGFTISVAMYLFMPMMVELARAPTSSGYGLGVSSVVGGCILIPMSVGSVTASRIAPAYERRFGRRTMVPFGSVLFAVAMAGFAIEHTSLWEALVASGIGGVGIGFTYAAMPGFIAQNVDPLATGSAMSFFQLLRNIGLATGSALNVAILARFTTGGAEPRVTAFEVSLLIGAGLCAATAVFSYLLPGPARPVVVPDAVTIENAELAPVGIAVEAAPDDGRRVPRWGGAT